MRFIEFPKIFSNKHADAKPVVTPEITQPNPLEATKTPDDARNERIRIAELTSQITTSS